VKREDADRAGVTEHYDASAAVCGNDFVELVSRAVQELAIALAAGQHVFEISAKECGVFFRVRLRGVFESQTFHNTDTSFAKRFGRVNREMRQCGQWPGCFDSTRQVT
jgi:hypothetical protein